MRLGKTSVPATAVDILKGTGVAAAITVVASLAFAAVLKAFPIPDGAIPAINQTLKIASVTAGSLLAVGRGGDKGLIKGATTGIGYMALGVLVYFLLDGGAMSAPAALADLGLGAITGSVAGVLAANLTPVKAKAKA